MSDILHYQTFDTNQAWVRKVPDHLAPGGRLVVKDRFLDEAGTGPLGRRHSPCTFCQYATRRLLQNR